MIPDIGIANLKKAAMKHHDNRGASAGILDIKKLPGYANDPSKFIKRTKFSGLKRNISANKR